MNKQIERTIESLKIMSSNGQKSFKIFQLRRLPADVRCTFYQPADEKDLKKLEEYRLPIDYLDFLRITNGMELFDEGGSMGVTCHIFSVQETFQVREAMKNSGYYTESDLDQYFPVLQLRDIGEIYIDRIKCANKEYYLTYPFPDNNYFPFNFAEWLERYVISEGHEFWYFTN